MPKIPEDLESYYRSTNDWKRGKEEGYPECCIKHFIWMQDFLRIMAASHMMDAVYGQSDEEYVQCPRCRIKKLVVQILTSEGGLHLNNRSTKS